MSYQPFLRVRLKSSLIGQTIQQRKVVNGLGLRRLGHEVVVANTPSFRGMVKKVMHLLEVEEVASSNKK